jgi:Mn-dependent DtxR family transcriptional regulator
MTARISTNPNRLLGLISKLLEDDGGSWTVEELSDWLKVPESDCRRMLWRMCDSGLVLFDREPGQLLMYRWSPRDLTREFDGVSKVNKEG